MKVSLIFGAVVLLLIVISVRERIRQRLHREKDLSFIGEEKPVLSPGTDQLNWRSRWYLLTLVVLTEFLELQLPELINLFGISLEPLAAVSIFMALVQPYLQRVLNAWRRL